MAAMAPDGMWSWIICLACFVYHLLIDGILNSFGLIFIELVDYFKETKATTALISSLANGICFIIGPFVAILVNKFGCRAVAVSGAIIISSGMIVSIFAPNVTFLCFSLGGMFGLGTGMVYLPSIVCISQYFEKHRALAIGIAVSGSGIGTFFFSPFTSYLIKIYGWQGAILIQGGLVLHCVACGLVYRTIETPVTTETRPSEDCSLENKSTLVSSSTCISSLNGNNKIENDILKLVSINGHNSPPCIHDDNTITEPLVCQNAAESDTSGNLCYQRDDIEMTGQIKENRAKLHSLRTTFANLMKKIVDTTIFRIPVFCLFVISVFFYSLGYYVPYIYIPDGARIAGIDEDKHSWLLSIIGITNTIARVMIGSLSDWKGVNRLMMYSTALLVCGVMTIILAFCWLFEVLLIYAIIFGLTSGVTASLASVILTDIVGIKRLTDAFGIYCFFAGMAIFMGPPFVGWLSDVSGNYKLSFIFAGIVIALGGVILFFAPCLEQKKS